MKIYFKDTKLLSRKDETESHIRFETEHIIDHSFVVTNNSTSITHIHTRAMLQENGLSSIMIENLLNNKRMFLVMILELKSLGKLTSKGDIKNENAF